LNSLQHTLGKLRQDKDRSMKHWQREEVRFLAVLRNAAQRRKDLTCTPCVSMTCCSLESRGPGAEEAIGDELEQPDAEAVAAPLPISCQALLRALCKFTHLRRRMLPPAASPIVASDEESSGEVATNDSCEETFTDDLLRLFWHFASGRVSGGVRLMNLPDWRRFLRSMDDFATREDPHSICESLRETVYEEQVSMQVDLPHHYGLRSYEAAKGLCFESFKVCLHVLVFHAVGKRQFLKFVALRRHFFA